MSRPAKPRESFDREIGQLTRLRRVVEVDAKAARSKLWHKSVLTRVGELLTLFLQEDTRRRVKS